MTYARTIFKQLGVRNINRKHLYVGVVLCVGVVGVDVGGGGVGGVGVRHVVVVGGVGVGGGV
eukprot:438504-Lingulodinium_polyedra.AAC.1